MEPLDLRNNPQAESESRGTPPSGGSSRRGFWQKMKTGDKVFAIVLIAVFLFVFYVALDANKYRATVAVIEGEGKVGVNPTTESLDFGDLSPGTSAVRRVTIKNSSGISMFVSVVRFGAISDLMELNDNYFVLGPDSEKQIEFTVYMPASAPVGDVLNGRVWLFKIPGPWGA